jgi:hypothetical protein
MSIAPRIAIRLIIPLLVLGFAGYRYHSANHQVGQALDQVNRDLDPNAASGGNDKSSLFRSDNLSGALNKLKGQTGGNGRLADLIVYPSYIVAQVAGGSNGAGQTFKVQSDGKVIGVPVNISPTGSTSGFVAISKLDTNIPVKLGSALAAKKPGTTLDNVAYMHLSTDGVSGKPAWDVYLKSGSYYSASLDGSGLRPGGAAANAATSSAAKAVTSALRSAHAGAAAPSTSVGGGSANAAAASAETAASKAVGDAQKRIACIQAAAGDAVKMEACSQ